MRAKFGVLQTHGTRLPAKFRLDQFILSPCGGEKPQFCRFWTSAFNDVANWHQSQKVEHGCTTTNLFSGGSWVTIEQKVAWAEAYLHTKWHLSPSCRLATTDIGQKLGAVPL